MVKLLWSIMDKIRKIMKTEALMNYSGPIKVGSTVKILSGNCKNRHGKVIAFNRKKGLIKVEGLMMRTHFVKAKDNGGNGGTIVLESFFPVCKAKIISEVNNEKTN